MREIHFPEIAQLAKKARGTINKLYLHWTGAGYEQKFDNYHFNINGHGAIYTPAHDLTKLRSHTWGRNLHSIGIAICCCQDAIIYTDGSFTLGSKPPTTAQIESMAYLVALLTTILSIPLDQNHVMTHAEAADIDGYGPKKLGTRYFERWDLWQLPDYDCCWRPGGLVLRGKAAYYKLTK